MVNPNYREINAEEQIKRSDSVFAYYKKLIQFRKQMEIITEGNYELLLKDDKDLYVYTRTTKHEALFIACNFSGEEHCLEVPEKFHGAKILIANEEAEAGNNLKLGPYGAAVLFCG
jgi:oligo-1,6-glucosidase